MGANAPCFLPAVGHGLTRAAHTAYALHYPLVLSPDAIWLAIAQGFAAHVNANAERLRGRFVRHAGRATIRIQRDDFVKGSPRNRWPEAFDIFSDAVAEYIGRQRDLVVCDFSTTGLHERAASEIVLLDAMQSYFKYEFFSRCGIPAITLDGTPDDWRAIRRRALALEEYELAWWTSALGPVLDELVSTAEGRVDIAFWKAFFKHENESGGPLVRGWINVLFPYVSGRVHPGERETYVRNEQMAAWTQGLETRGSGSASWKIPSGLSCVPFEWTFLPPMEPAVFPMELLGGFVGVSQDPATLAVRPAIGWAVRDAVDQGEPAGRSFDNGMSMTHVSSEAALIAGRIGGAISLTVDDVLALRARVERLGESIGVPFTCTAAGSLATFAAFAEYPYSIRLVVGVCAASISRGERRCFGIDDLRHALDAARAIPEATWCAVAKMLPGDLQGLSSLYVAVSGQLDGLLRFGERRNAVGVCAVSTTGAATAEVDVSSEAHDARVEDLRKFGGTPDSATYMLGIP
jgi:uncharacterized protein DUF4419